QGSVADGWQQLASQIQSVFDPNSLEKASLSVFGISVVYWIMCNEGLEPADYEPLKLNGATIRCSNTDAGLLWCSDSPFLEKIKTHQDFWMIVTPRSSEIEAKVNARFYAPLIPD